MMLMVGFGFDRPLSVYIELWSPSTERKKERKTKREREREMIGERNISKQHPLASTVSTLEPYPTQIQISRTPRHSYYPVPHHPSTRLLPDAEEAVALQMDMISNGHVNFKVSLQINAVKFRFLAFYRAMV